MMNVSGEEQTPKPKILKGFVFHPLERVSFSNKLQATTKKERGRKTNMYCIKMSSLMPFDLIFRIGRVVK